MEESKHARTSGPRHPYDPRSFDSASSQPLPHSRLSSSPASLSLNHFHSLNNMNSASNTNSGSNYQNISISNNALNNHNNTSAMYYQHPQHRQSYYSSSCGRPSGHLSHAVTSPSHHYLRGPLVPRPVLSRNRSSPSSNRNSLPKESNSCTEVALIFRPLDMFPVYEVIRLGGKDHEPLFEATISVPQFGLHAKGQGGSKIACRRAAAESLIQLLKDRNYRSHHIKDPDSEKIIAQSCCAGITSPSQTITPVEGQNHNQISSNAGKGEKRISTPVCNNAPLFFEDRKPDLLLENPSICSPQLSPVVSPVSRDVHDHRYSKLEPDGAHTSDEACTSKREYVPQSNDIDLGRPSKTPSQPLPDETPVSNDSSKEVPSLTDVSRVQAGLLVSAQPVGLDGSVLASPLKRSLAKIVTGGNYSKPEPLPVSSSSQKSPAPLPMRPVPTASFTPRPLSGSASSTRLSKLNIRSVPPSKQSSPPIPLPRSSDETAPPLNLSSSVTDQEKKPAIAAAVSTLEPTPTPCQVQSAFSLNSQILNDGTTPPSVSLEANIEPSKTVSNMKSGSQRFGSPARNFSLKKAASAAASASKLGSLPTVAAPITARDSPVAVGSSLRASSGLTTFSRDGHAETNKLASPRLENAHRSGSPCVVESVPPRKRAKSLMHELPVSLRLQIFAALDDESAKQSIIALAHSTLYVDLEVVLFSSNARVKYHTLCERVTAQVEAVQVDTGVHLEAAIRARIAFAVGVASQKVWIDRAKHSALHLPLALSPQLVIVHSDPMFNALREESVIDVFCSGESLVDYAERFLLDAKKELVNLRSNLSERKMSSVDSKGLNVQKAVYDFRDSPTSTTSTKGDAEGVAKAKQ